jgi:hypothetical protein
VDKGTGDAKQARWYYDHEDGVCKVSGLIFYLFIFFIISTVPVVDQHLGRKNQLVPWVLLSPKTFTKFITRQDTTNQVEKFYNSGLFSPKILPGTKRFIL